MHRRRFIGSAAAGAGFLFGRNLPAVAHAGPGAQLRVNGARIAERLRTLAQFGRNADGGIDRVAYGDADLAARDWVMGAMREAGLDVRMDTAGNIIGRRAGLDDARPPLMTGSHIDSVPGGGNYDGQVGAVAALEVAQTLADQNVRLRHPLEVVIFQNEENGKVGSKAMRGQDPASYLDLMTHSGKMIRDGIRFIGGDPARLSEAARQPGSIAAFLELHIEQGAVLERAGVPIGIVLGIVGIKRWAVTVEGFANHAGTTPMDQRRDALLGAARFVDAANRVARSVPGRHVATVGTLTAEPGAPNVIAGRALLTLEMRDLELDTVDGLFERMRVEADRVAAETDTRFEFTEIYRTLPARTDERMRAVIAEAAGELNLATQSLPSGAGHDAQEIAQLAPMGMIFVPSIGGISHSPREFSESVAIENGANVLLHALTRCDRHPDLRDARAL
jgi:N-carbamoyl-L-amino-acid hydrolase